MGIPINGSSDVENPSGTAGVRGNSSIFDGVIGYTTADGHAGVAGVADSDTLEGNGVYGRSKLAHGVIGISTSTIGHAGVAGVCDEGIAYGVYGRSVGNDGIIGITTATGKAGLAGVCEQGNGNGIYGRSTNGYAGYFEGNVFVHGNVTATGDIFLANADFAEDFDIVDNMGEPGTVMVLSTDGGLKQSTSAYDKKVAGVISGAGNFKPGIILDHQANSEARKPLAMVGKVYCRADASYGDIEIGDLLTSSDTAGHAMKATDHSKAFGAIIGKALGTLKSGTGLIPILVSLQ